VAAIQALADRAHGLAPLGHSAEVAHPFADGDEDAQGPRRGDWKLELLSDGDSRGLVQPPQAFVDVALDHPRRALDRDAQRLEIGDAQVVSQRGRFSALGRPRFGIGVDLERVVALHDQQPAVVRGRWAPVEQRPAALQPPRRDRVIAAEVQGIVGQPTRHSRRAAEIARSAVGAERLLARGERSVGVAQP
jgi:hypothetical protein